MQKALLPRDEEQRLRALYDYKILDTPREESFDRIIRLITKLFAAPLATVTLVDRDRQWFKSSCGVDACETDRGISFCGHVVYQGAPLIIPDTHSDPRFADNPLVIGPPYVRFYAGVPLTTHDGWHVGVLCVQDQQPRPHGFSDDDLKMLTEIAAITIDELELRKAQRLVENEQEVARRVINFAARSELLSGDGVRHLYRPAERLSGDLLLAARRPISGTALFLLGDFTGHGIGAAIGVPALSGKFYELVAEEVASDQILSALNDYLCRYLPPEMFMTAALIEVGRQQGECHLTVWNAGLPTVLLLTGDGPVANFPSEGLPLGIMPGAAADSMGLHCHQPPAQARLYACSDGVIESRLADGTMLGLEGLERLLRGQSSLAGGFERVEQELAAARQRSVRDVDDIALLELDLTPLCAEISSSSQPEGGGRSRRGRRPDGDAG